MNRALFVSRLSDACRKRDESSLLKLCANLGFAQPKRSATNLFLLADVLDDSDLLAALALDALETADPDLALNGLERLTGVTLRNDLVPVLDAPATRRQLLTILGASPFLTGILCRDPATFRQLFGENELNRPKDEDTMLAELRRKVPANAPFPALQQALRRYKHQEFSRIGGRDLCGLADLAEVTGELSALAAACLQVACEVCGLLLKTDFGTPLIESEDDQSRLNGTEAEFTVLGMGKFGGRELNFSSDIDLIYFYTSERGQTTGVEDPLGKRINRIHLHQYFAKLAELVTKAVGEATEDGFVFRVDLRLRPEGHSGEMANSLRSAEIYYESWGQSWERAALIKARPVAGSIPLGEQLLDQLAPFVFRKYLDYGMIEDIKGMKLKIDRSLVREREGELNLKLGRGGIREIEFFIQALQLIYAGKKPALRERNSLKALNILLQEGLIKPEEHTALTEAYVFLRTVEHRIQVEQERQTHLLPTRPDQLQALARRCGFPDSESFAARLEEHRQKVSTIYRELFFTEEEEVAAEVSPEVPFLLDPGTDHDRAMDILEEKGFPSPAAALESILWLRDGPPHSHLTQRARRHLERIAPWLLHEVLASPEPAMALANLERFLGAMRARATHYALLAENREIIKVLVSLFGTSQFLSRIFIQHPEILDTLVSRTYAVSFKDRDTLSADLQTLMDLAGDYEEKLDALRRFRHEEFLRIALNDIQEQTGQGRGTVQLSYLADVCLHQAFAIAREELLPRYGLPFCKDGGEATREAEFVILGMGKLGGMELNYHSDLDIIFIYEGEGETRNVVGTTDARFRPQTNPQYFSRLAQRIISVLTLMTREGYVYQIDTRLRPSGNQGPLVTSLAAYEKYHQTAAQLWERQALTKARVVLGPARLSRRIEEMHREIVYERPLGKGLKGEVFRLRGRMETEIAREDESNINIKTGRGGMVDVEFLAQYLQLHFGRDYPELQQQNTLRVLNALNEAGLLSHADFQVLAGGYKFLRRLENRLRLIHDQSINELSGNPAYLAKLARRLGYPERPVRPDVSFLQEYRRVTENIREVFDRFLGPESPS